MPRLLDLARLTRRDLPEVGPKAAHLGEMLRLGWPVPAGFCVPACVQREFLESSGLGSLVDQLLGAPSQSCDVRAQPGHSGSGTGTGETHGLAEVGEQDARAPEGKADLDFDALTGLREAHRSALLPSSLVEEIGAAYRDLLAGARYSRLVVVRSSALDEDGAELSAAGVHDTFLGVASLEELLERLVQCWASVWTASAVAYRRRARGSARIPAAMGVIVQELIPSDASGVVFTLDPATGAERLVVEAAWGLSESVVRGEIDVDRYTLCRETLEVEQSRVSAQQWMRLCPARGGGSERALLPVRLRGRPALTHDQLRRLAELALLSETHFGCPQDLEWGRIGDELFLFQSRPITGRPAPLDEVFTHRIPNDRHLWTSGFLNERFPDPVSPLGWSVIRAPLETLAYRDPLRWIGADDVARLPLTKLRHGHPYANLAVFQALYRPFPRWLLPEDVARYFPDGDVSLIWQGRGGRHPISPLPFLSILRQALQDPGNWSPWHNHRGWRRFLPRYEANIAALEAACEEIAPRLASGHEAGLDHIRELVDRIVATSDELLRYHRWSLTHADVAYSLAHRALVALMGPERGAEISGHLLSRLPTRSRGANEALQELAVLLSRSDALKATLARALAGRADVETLCGDDEDGLAFRDALRRYLSAYGHRSLSLDILRPSLRDDPRQIVRLALALSERDAGETGAGRPTNNAGQRDDSGASLRERAVLTLLRPLLGLAGVYLELREEQRFYWQKGLSLLRRVFLLAGASLQGSGALEAPDDIFYLTAEEVFDPSRSDRAAELRRLVSLRRAQFRRLEREFEMAPSLAYPPFLRGSEPLPASDVVSPGDVSIRGVPVSAGRVTGTARVLRTAAGLDAVADGEILVTTSPDPGWTPVFGKIAGLVMEYGGQLSHGSVVAREYGLPAVARATMATELLHDGDLILVDGYSGTVIKLPGGA